ncbi:MAG: lysylphosphatidylglycerol synthase transmembrane domain-containing protein [Candidatus Acidiferrales bacterium]
MGPCGIHSGKPQLGDTAQVEADRKPDILRLVGYGLALISIVWVFRDFHLRRTIREFSNVSWRWVFLGMLFDVLSYFVQGLRWKLLLTPFGRVRFIRATRAIFAGLFANLSFPLRPGELLRSYLLSNWEEISFGKVLGSVGVERLVDLVVATATLAVASLFVELPGRFKTVADALGIAALVLLAVVVGMILYLEFKMASEPETFDPNRGPKRHLPSRWMRALIALHAMGTAPSFYPAVLASLLMPFCQVLALWSLMKAYKLPLSFLAAVVVLLVINLGISLPNAPANVGSYQFFCVLGLSVFQIEKATAAGFSIFAFLALTIPFIFLGFAAMLRSGLSLKTLREQVMRLPSEAQKRPAYR